jgi:hypothetical protein
MKHQSKPDWIDEQLKKLYNDIIHEPLPADMVRLLEQLDQAEETRQEPEQSSSKDSYDG